MEKCSYMELIVKNFGPIKDAHIQTKRYNVFIGNTSTGKSVLAKLISIAYELEFYFIEDGNFAAYTKLLRKYCIDFPFSDSTKIEISFALAHWIITKDNIKIIKSVGNPFFTQNVITTSNNKEVASLYREISIDKKMDNDIDPTNPIFEEAKKTYNELVNNIVHNQKTDLSKYSQPAIDIAYRAFLVNVYEIYGSIYIPAERNLMSVFTNNIFTFLKSGSNIPESIKRFGSLYELAKGENKKLSIAFMNIKVDFTNEDDKITLNDEGAEIRFEQASSGLQSIIPLWSVFLYGIKKHAQATAIIEEPELNLFPTLQVDLVNNLVAQLNNTKANLLITTHSPYILSVMDNLIYANDVYQKAKAENKDEQIKRIEKLVAPSMLINYDEVAAYWCKDDGNVVCINDDEIRGTGAYALDKASETTGNIYNELMVIDNEL